MTQVIALYENLESVENTPKVSWFVYTTINKVKEVKGNMAARKESALEQRQRRQREDMEEKDKQLAAQCEDIEGRFPPRKSIPKPSWANLSPGELFMHNYKIHAKPAADSSQTSEEKTVEKKQAAADASTQAAEQVEQAEEKERKRRTAQYIARKIENFLNKDAPLQCPVCGKSKKLTNHDGSCDSYFAPDCNCNVLDAYEKGGVSYNDQF